MEKIANVRLAENQNHVAVPISSQEKPDISEDFEKKWQELVDLAARIIGVPAGLIMRFFETEVEVFTSSHTKSNPHQPGETVVGKRKELAVPFAPDDDNWKNNPDIELNMVSYFGVPVLWPDGEVFGTFCILDDKENHYTADQKVLIAKFAELVERYLKILLDQDQM